MLDMDSADPDSMNSLILTRAPYISSKFFDLASRVFYKSEWFL